jgi:hypothetical protein
VGDFKGNINIVEFKKGELTVVSEFGGSENGSIQGHRKFI